MLAAIPYTTFPTVALGPLHLRTFGLMVGLGVLIGAWVAGALRRAVRRPARRAPTAWPPAWSSPASSAPASRGSSPTRTRSSRRSTSSPSGRAACSSPAASSLAIMVGFPTFRKWNRLTRWQMLDGYASGLAIGLAIGRIGCIAVGEHFGSTDQLLPGHPLRRRGDPRGHPVRPCDGRPAGVRPPRPVSITRGMEFHNTALYELRLDAGARSRSCCCCSGGPPARRGHRASASSASSTPSCGAAPTSCG